MPAILLRRQPRSRRPRDRRRSAGRHFGEVVFQPGDLDGPFVTVGSDRNRGREYTLAGSGRFHTMLARIDWHGGAPHRDRDDDAVHHQGQADGRGGPGGGSHRQRRQLPFERGTPLARHPLAVAVPLLPRAAGGGDILRPRARGLALPFVAHRQSQQRCRRGIEPLALGQLRARRRKVLLLHQLGPLAKQRLRGRDVRHLGSGNGGRQRRQRERPA